MSRFAGVDLSFQSHRAVKKGVAFVYTSLLPFISLCWAVEVLSSQFKTCLWFQAHLVGVGEVTHAHGSCASPEQGPAWRGNVPASAAAGSGWSGCAGAAGSCCTFPWGEMSLQRKGDNFYQCVSIWLYQCSH